MNTLFYSAQDYETAMFDEVNAAYGHRLTYLEAPLTPETVKVADGQEAVCVFVNDQLDRPVLAGLRDRGVRAVALRCAGFNHVDLEAAVELGLQVVRVPAYSPHAVAEHTLCLVMALNRKVHRAYNRVREGNFTLDGLMGFDLHGKTAGLVGTGKIGQCMAAILRGLGMEVLAYDRYPSDAAATLGVTYVELDELFARSDVISLHCPLTPETHHLIDDEAVRRMKPGVMIVNTSRGGVVDTSAVIRGLKSGAVGSLGLDVYEEEGDYFFHNLSDRVIQDDQLARLLTFPNVIITGHQAFFTREALHAIADTTLANLRDLETAGTCANAVTAKTQIHSSPSS